jgi:hypothetical protein
MQIPPGKIRRLVFIISGVTDAFIGAVLVALGLGIVPADFLSQDFSGWMLTAIGIVMFIAGVGVAVYNFSRWEE